MPTLLSESASTGPAETYGMIVMQQACGIPGVLLAAWLINTKFGRKWTTAIPFFLSGLVTLIFFFSQSLSTVMACTTFANLFSYMGWGAIYTIVPESYETNVRSFGVGWANVMSKLGGVVTPTVTGLMLELSFTMTILFLAVCLMLVGVVSAFMTETRGKVIV